MCPFFQNQEKSWEYFLSNSLRNQKKSKDQEKSKDQGEKVKIRKKVKDQEQKEKIFNYWLTANN